MNWTLFYTENYYYGMIRRNKNYMLVLFRKFHNFIECYCIFRKSVSSILFFQTEISYPNNETEILFSESLNSVKQFCSRYYPVFIVRPTRRIPTFTNISDCIIFARSLTLPSASHISQAQSSLTRWTLLWVPPAYCKGIWLYNQSQSDIQFCHRLVLNVNK